MLHRALEFHRAFQARKLTPTKAKDRLELSLSEVTYLANGDFERFSVARLLTLLTLLNHNVEACFVQAEETPSPLFKSEGVSYFDVFGRRALGARFPVGETSGSQ